MWAGATLQCMWWRKARRCADPFLFAASLFPLHPVNSWKPAEASNRKRRTCTPSSSPPLDQFSPVNSLSVSISRSQRLPPAWTPRLITSPQKQIRNDALPGTYLHGNEAWTRLIRQRSGSSVSLHTTQKCHRFCFCSNWKLSSVIVALKQALN